MNIHYNRIKYSTLSRIFITGSTDGLGKMAAKALIARGHQLVLHARNARRAEDIRSQLPQAEDILTGDLSDFDETVKLAEKINMAGAFDAIIHNAGVYQVPGDLIFRVNTLAPYVLTCLVTKPKRLVYLSSQMQAGGSPARLESDFAARSTSYSSSKLHVILLAKVVARVWPGVLANTVDPGWVPTKMGGAGAPDDLQKGWQTQVWLATSSDPAARVSGQYFYHMQAKHAHPMANDIQLQDQFIAMCERSTGIAFPS